MKKGIFSGNALKFIAMISMLFDHAAIILFDNLEPFRIIGRLAFPLYAYLIAEGCRYTSSKFIYFLRIFAIGALCQLVYYFVDKSLYMNILLTFSVSIPMVYLLQLAKKNAFFTLLFLFATAFMWMCFQRLASYGVTFDYGFFGMMFPVLLSVTDNKKEKALLAFFGLFVISQTLGGYQIWSLLAVPLFLLYNGKRGKLNMKTFFYSFYPLHLAILWGLKYLVDINVLKF